MNLSLPSLLTLPSVWAFLLTALAVYRVGFLIAEDDGPFFLFRTSRAWLWKHSPEWIAQGFSCFFCVTFWVALLGAILLSGLSLESVVVWLSLATFVSLLRRLEMRLDTGLSALARMASKR